MIRAEHLYRVVMHADPPGFREDFGREMTLVFRDQQPCARLARLVARAPQSGP